MKLSKSKLKSMIVSNIQDIEFTYKGTHGAICPFSEDFISIGFGDIEVDCKSIDEVMASTIFDGKTLEQICDEADFF